MVPRRLLALRKARCADRGLTLSRSKEHDQGLPSSRSIEYEVSAVCLRESYGPAIWKLNSSRYAVVKLTALSESAWSECRHVFHALYVRCVWPTSPWNDCGPRQPLLLACCYTAMVNSAGLSSRQSAIHQSFSGFRSFPSINGNPMLINFPSSSFVSASIIRIRNHHTSRLPSNHQITCIRLNKSVQSECALNAILYRLASVPSHRATAQDRSRNRLLHRAVGVPLGSRCPCCQACGASSSTSWCCSVSDTSAFRDKRLTHASFSGGAKRGRGGRGGKRAGDRPAKTQEELDKEMTVRRTSRLTLCTPDELCFYELRTTSTPTPLLKLFSFSILHDLACASIVIVFRDRSRLCGVLYIIVAL